MFTTLDYSEKIIATIRLINAHKTIEFEILQKTEANNHPDN